MRKRLLLSTTVANAILILLLVSPVACVASDQAAQAMTPVLLAVKDAPIPFNGSDGRVHLVYELWLSNFSSGNVSVEQVEVVADGVVLETFDAAAIAKRLQPAGTRKPSGTMAAGSQSLLFIHLTLAPNAAAPKQLTHRLMLQVDAAPPGQNKLSESGGDVEVDRRKVIVIGPPLRGERYIAADSCCDASRHTRAALPVNGRVWVTQRYAVDWEQMDASGRIYSGPQADLKTYTIYGRQVLAVADAVVSSTTDGLPEQTPGQYPTNISLDQADGNSVILDLGEGRYAVYAHMQPGSLRVHRGDRVKRGQVLGLVGNTGNSLAPHLHFHVMDGPLPLASNGLPYEIDSFEVTGATGGTEAFDEAEEKGTPVAVEAITPAQAVHDALPLDQKLISFGNSE